MKALLWLVTASIAWISIWLWILATQTSAYLQERGWIVPRSEEHTSELQSRLHLVCRLLLEKKKTAHRALRPPVLLPAVVDVLTQPLDPVLALECLRSPLRRHLLLPQTVLRLRPAHMPTIGD